MDGGGEAGTGSEAGREPWERPQRRVAGEQKGPDPRCSGRSIHPLSSGEALGNSSIPESLACEMGAVGRVTETGVGVPQLGEEPLSLSPGWAWLGYGRGPAPGSWQ